MRTIIGWLCATLLGWAGWWLGARVGLGIAVVLSAITGGLGLYLGYRWFDQNLGSRTLQLFLVVATLLRTARQARDSLQ